ncbi:MAG: rhomboid family intramembrane serine protease [Deltaproteobacteria bacterium]|nr:rhomboid family intramembrane serine protease [Deltaproteobacteria bacterium]
MIPLRDANPSQSFPFVTVLLIVVNTVVFFHESELGSGLERFILAYGFVPAVYFHHSYVDPWNFPARFTPMVTSMFLHGGWMHLIGNMWTLWIFGDNVEDRLGRGRYLLYYLGCGLAACYIHYLTGPRSGIPVVGASGAIAGVMGGYFILFPRARIVTLVPIFIFLQIVTIPAVFFLAFWFLLQLLNGAVATAASFGGGVAWWAHVGGFITGALLILPKRREHYESNF